MQYNKHCPPWRVRSIEGSDEFWTTVYADIPTNAALHFMEDFSEVYSHIKHITVFVQALDRMWAPCGKTHKINVRQVTSWETDYVI